MDSACHTANTLPSSCTSPSAERRTDRAALFASSEKLRDWGIEDEQIIRLSVDDQQRFVDLVLNPPPLAPAMKRALKARKRLIAGAK